MVGDLTTFYIVFKSPYSKATIKCHKTRGSIAWLEKNYYVVQWDDGVTIFNHDLIKKLLKPFHEVYITGLEKYIFLDQFHNNIREIGGTAMDATFNGKCCVPKHENDSARCALRSASVYYK